MPENGLQQLTDRLAAVDRILADPPDVHAFHAEHMRPAPGGVWSADRACYRFLASHCAPGARTLETGLGVSTLLFAAIGARHTCVAPLQEEVDRCAAYCRSRGISLERVSFEVGWSDEILPKLSSGPLDLFFIDGGHAFPIPILDWFYGGSRLRHGGVLVVDDLQLPAVSGALLGFLDKDPRWKELERTPRWAGYERASDGTLREGWGAQPERGIFPWAPRESLLAKGRSAAARFLRRRRADT